MSKQFKSINKSLSNSLKFATFAVKQLFFGGFVFALALVVFLLLNALLGLPLQLGVSISAWLGLTCVFLSGDKAHQFWGQFFPFIPSWVRGHVPHTSPISKPHLGNKNIRGSLDSAKTLTPFEDQIQLLTLCRIEQERSPPIACYILGANSGKRLDLSHITVKCELELQGFNPLQNGEEEYAILNTNFETLVKDIETSYIFRSRSWCDYTDAREQVEARLQNPVSNECAYLDHATLARIQELTKHHKRKKVSLSVESTFTQQTDTSTQDWLDKWIASVKSFWQRKIENKGREQDQQQLILLLRSAYTAFERDKQILQEARLQPRFKTETEIGQELGRRLGSDQAVPTSVLVLDEHGLQEEINLNLAVKNSTHQPSLVTGSIHLSSKLIQDGVPIADRSWVCLQAGNKPKYVGVLVLADKPAGFNGEAGQLLYLSQVLSKEDIFDVELVTEISKASIRLVHLSQQQLTRNAVSRQDQAQVHGTVEVSAQLSLESSLEAQRQLGRGDVPVYASVVILIYRNSLSELDEACRRISDLVRQPAKLIRETDYAWLIWLQSTGLRREAILSTPYFRRLTFFASEVSSVCNLAQIPPADKRGLELISQYGNSPVFLDLNEHKNILVLGTTGSGKSVLVASMIVNFLACGRPFFIIDYPNKDGSGTFGDFTKWLNAIYFDVSRESINLMQRLNLEHITDEQDRQWRQKAHLKDVTGIVTQLILGDSSSLDGFLMQTIKSVIPLIINAFYEDKDIQARFTAAQRDGFDSIAWGNTPTLRDLPTFVSSERINLGYENADLKQALQHINLRLQYWLHSSLAQTIARPNSFYLNKGNCNLFTFALTNVQTDEEAAMYGLSALSLVRQQILTFPQSAFFMDEASVLLRFPFLSAFVGNMSATARKAGLSMILATQDVDSINKCPNSEQIIQNMSCRLIGRILPGASSSYEKILGIAKEIIGQNERFQTDKTQGFTRWLLDYQNSYIQCRYYPSYPLLALTANSPAERCAREKFKMQYANKFEYLTKFYRYYKQQLQQGGIK